MANNPLNNKYTAVATFDLADMGTIAEAVSAGCATPVIIPEGAMITNCVAFVHTALAGQNAAQTVSFGLGTAGVATGSAGDNKAIFFPAVALNNTSDGMANLGAKQSPTLGFLALTGDAVTDDAEAILKAATYHVTTANEEVILVTGATHDLTGGRVSLYIDYVLTGKLA